MKKVINTKKYWVGGVTDLDKNDTTGAYVRFNQIGGFTHKYILFQNPKPTDTTVKEYLTGVEFDLIRTLGAMRFGFKKDLSSAVVFENSRIPSNEFLEDYINRYSDIDAYREELLQLKAQMKDNKRKNIENTKARKQQQRDNEINENDKRVSLLNKIVEMRTAYNNRSNIKSM